MHHSGIVSAILFLVACSFTKTKLIHLSVREILNPKKHFRGFTFNNLDEVIIVLPW